MPTPGPTGGAPRPAGALPAAARRDPAAPGPEPGGHGGGGAGAGRCAGAAAEQRGAAHGWVSCDLVWCVVVGAPGTTGVLPVLRAQEGPPRSTSPTQLMSLVWHAKCSGASPDGFLPRPPCPALPGQGTWRARCSRGWASSRSTAASAASRRCRSWRAAPRSRRAPTATPRPDSLGAVGPAPPRTCCTLRSECRQGPAAPRAPASFSTPASRSSSPPRPSRPPSLRSCCRSRFPTWAASGASSRSACRAGRSR
jgi:hypothetical protein